MIKIEKSRYFLIFLVISMAFLLYIVAINNKKRNDYKNKINTNYTQYLNSSNPGIKNVAHQINVFFQEAKIRNHKVTTQRVNLSFETYESLNTKKLLTLGHCFYDEDNDIAKIYINPIVINNPNQVWSLIFHELGHCLLGLSHDDSFLDISGVIPASLMTSLESNPDEIMVNKKYYTDELFSKKQDDIGILQQLINHQSSWVLFKVHFDNIVDSIKKNQYNEIPGFIKDTSSEIFNILSLIFILSFLYIFGKTYGERIFNFLKAIF